MLNYNILDAAILVILIAGAFYGVYRGFVYSLLSFAGKILSAVLAVKFLEDFIKYVRIKELFLDGVINIVKDHLPVAEEIKNIEISGGTLDFGGLVLPDVLMNGFFGKNISREIERLYGVAEGFSLKTVGDFLALVLANYIINILAFIALFLLFLTGFSLIRGILVKIIGVSDIITAIDKVLGFAFGGAVNLLITAFVLGVSYDLLNFLALKDGGLLATYRDLINTSGLKEYLYFLYSLIINEGTKLL